MKIFKKKLLCFIPPENNQSDYCEGQRQLLRGLSECLYYMPAIEIEVPEIESHRSYREMVDKIFGNERIV